MVAEIINGKLIAQELLDEITEKLKQIKIKNFGFSVKLAIVQVYKN
jgi:5,10-methylene-tetrahydrofolate dehydrogenase/methenyl tetrahydrofolate cyclohydrolase